MTGTRSLDMRVNIIQRPGGLETEDWIVTAPEPYCGPLSV